MGDARQPFLCIVRVVYQCDPDIGFARIFASPQVGKGEKSAGNGLDCVIAPKSKSSLFPVANIEPQKESSRRLIKAAAVAEDAFRYVEQYPVVGASFSGVEVIIPKFRAGG